MIKFKCNIWVELCWWSLYSLQYVFWTRGESVRWTSLRNQRGGGESHGVKEDRLSGDTLLMGVLLSESETNSSPDGVSVWSRTWEICLRRAFPSSRAWGPTHRCAHMLYIWPLLRSSIRCFYPKPLRPSYMILVHSMSLRSRWGLKGRQVTLRTLSREPSSCGSYTLATTHTILLNSYNFFMQQIFFYT